jgi:hypothetical protein
MKGSERRHIYHDHVMSEIAFFSKGEQGKYDIPKGMEIEKEKKFDAPSYGRSFDIRNSEK